MGDFLINFFMLGINHLSSHEKILLEKYKKIWEK